MIDAFVSRAKASFRRARARYLVLDIVARTLQRHSEDDGGFHAAALTYYIFFSTFPLLLFTASILGYLTFIDDSFKQDLIEGGLEAFPLLDNALQGEGVALLERRRGTFALTGFLLALYSGTGAVVALEHALNRIHRVENEPGVIEARLRSLRWVALLGAGGLVLVAAAILADIAGDAFGTLGTVGKIVASAVLRVTGFVLGFFIFVTAFKMLPAVRQSWRDVVPGAAVAAVVFELLQLGASWYLRWGSTSRTATFGAFAVAAGLLVAAYLVSQITLLAAELNVVLMERRLAVKLRFLDKGGERG